MRKVFLDNLPKLKENKGERINWRKSIGFNVHFEFDDISGEIYILEYIKKGRKLLVRYLNNEHIINVDSLASARLSIVLGLMKEDYSYIYNIGEILNTNTSKIKILNQIRIDIKRGIKRNDETAKGYEYQCLICGNIDTMTEYQIKERGGCNVCYGRKILIGYNDLWTTHPEIAKLLENPNNGYTYTHGTHKKANFICPNCKTINKNRGIWNVVQRGLSCSQCSDGISYPNKFIFNLLHQLNLKVRPEYSPKWMERKRIDFYFKLNDKEYGLEADGVFHKKDNWLSGQSYNESKQNDDYKDNLMKKHNVEVIRIDCEYPTLEFIKDSVLKSNLAKIIDLSNINWLKCHEYACNSLVKVVCDMWDSGVNDTKQISNITKLYRTTVVRYLKQGAKLKWCDYDPAEEKKKAYEIKAKKMCKQVICLTTGEIFKSTMEASKKYNFKNSNGVSQCCRNMRKSSGIHPETGEKLVWMFYSDFNLKNNEEIKNLSNMALIDNRLKKIFCLTTNEVFNSISEASIKYNINGSNISQCCKGRFKSSGKLLDGTKLVWKYYDEYILELQ